MKPQDIVFVIFLSVVLYKKDARLAALLGLFSLVLAAPLFAAWVFFTAQRLTMYAAGFFLACVILFFTTLRERE